MRLKKVMKAEEAVQMIRSGDAVSVCGISAALTPDKVLAAGGLKVEVSEGNVKIVKEGKTRKFVERVQQITFNGQLSRKKAQKVIYITERGVFDLAPDGLVLREIAPGLDLQKEIVSRIEFKFKVAKDLKETDPSIFRPGLMGLKQMEQWRT